MATFILGAGFSKPAGLPLGDQLFSEILKLARQRGIEQIINRDIEFFLQYLKRTKGKRITEDEINLEEFISYLDIEHYLTLEGSDHWSGQGNKSQMTIRNLIALLIYSYERKITESQWSLYEDFVSRLDLNTWIFTFNYDTILEKMLEKKNIPFRLFPYRYKYNNETDYDDKDEIVILKMHGSINWFDKSYFDKSVKFLKEHYGQDNDQFNPIFNDPDRFQLRKLIDSPKYEDSLLNNIYTAQNLGEYFAENSFLLESPLIISPSYNKLVYLNPLREFWYGFNRMGSFDDRVSIIGFSLPSHDEYIRQPLYQLIRNFQHFKSTNKYDLKMIDYKKNQKDIREYKRKYRFVNPRKTNYHFDGFNQNALDLIFKDQKTWK